MAIQTIPTVFQVDLGQIAVNALKRNGPGNELGMNNSFLGMLGQRGLIKYNDGAFTKNAAKLVFEYASGDTSTYYDLDDAPHEPGNFSAVESLIAYAHARETMRLRNFDVAALGSKQAIDGNGLYAKTSQEALKNLIAKMETKLLTGLGSANDPLGLAFWVNDSSVIGGVDQATNTWLQSKIIAAGAASLSRKHLREAVGAVSEEQGGRTNLILSSKRQLDKYRELFDGKLQYINTKLGDVEVKVDAYDGIPWIDIPGMTTTLIYGLQIEDFSLEVLLQDAPDGSYPQLENLEQAGIPFALRYMGNVNDDQRYDMTNHHQLVCQKPWRQWLISGLSATLA